MITYLCDENNIEKNAKDKILKLSEDENIIDVFVFPDVHFSSESSMPVGISFNTLDVVYPLVSGKDIGCGVMAAKISKKDLLKPIDKTIYKSLYQAHLKMTDDSLGLGNHFLSIEEDDKNIYIICHTGSRNHGIYFYNKCLKMVSDYSADINKTVEYLPLELITNDFKNEYQQILKYSYNRRLNFIIKTFYFLQRAKILKSVEKIENNYLNLNYNYNLYHHSPDIEKLELNGINFEIYDSFHNYIEYGKSEIIHRKGATGLNNKIAVLPISMTRGSLLVKMNSEYALNSCAHGAGRKMSRHDTINYWNKLKEKERNFYYDNFSELLNNSGTFDNSVISEFDFAYKDITEIFKYQKHINKISETRPILTIKTLDI